MADETLFGWVHISDIHFGHGGASYTPNQKLVLDALRRDVAAKPEGRRVDAIFVTGDIAFSGNGVNADEYARAEEWLLALGSAAGVERSQIFVVPGNHDVNRGVDKRFDVGPLVESLREGRIAIDDLLADPKGTELLAARMEAYLAFAAKFAPGCLDTPAKGKLTWVRTLDGRGGLKVRLVGLNTSLLAKDRDEGKLRVGEKQLAESLLPSAEPGEVVVVLSHHPFRTGWLADEKNVDRWVRNNAHVHLSGHVHEAETEFAGSGGGETFVRVVAGAAHAERMPAEWIPASHGYSFGAVHAAGGNLSLRVYPRLWSDPKKKFVLDVNNVPEGSSYAEHPLRAKLSIAAPAESAKPKVPRVPRPTRVFISYAPEDEKMKSELVKALTSQRRAGEIEIAVSRSEGEVPRGSVDQKLQAAHVILVLLSTDYIANDYCFETELEAARARREAGEAVVMAVLLRPMELSKQAHFQRLASGEMTEQWYEKLTRMPYARERDQNDRPSHVNRDGIPVSTWAQADSAWTEIAKELRDEIAALRKA